MTSLEMKSRLSHRTTTTVLLALTDGARASTGQLVVFLNNDTGSFAGKLAGRDGQDDF
ncbi:MAG: hypothetical protein IPP40_14135 [bacterium]|nr:hypothetical protein [bacterium]